MISTRSCGRRKLLPLLALLLVSCRLEEAGHEPRWVDFVTDLAATGRLQSTEANVAVSRSFCADRYQHALSLRPGEEVTATLDLGSQPRLEMTGCLTERRRVRGPAALTVTLESRAGARLEQRLDLPLVTSWWSRTLDLGPLQGQRQVVVRLRAELPPGRSLVLADLFVKDERERTVRKERVESLPQVLLISVDTLRADSFAAFGGARSTPALDRFASRAQHFTPHYAGDTWTKPSHAALLTGQLAAVHGAGAQETAMVDQVPVLAERLAAAGFRTGGLVFDCRWLGPEFGFDRGFDDYRVVDLSACQK